jgi:hypothetical protein
MMVALAASRTRVSGGSLRDACRDFGEALHVGDAVARDSRRRSPPLYVIMRRPST